MMRAATIGYFPYQTADKSIIFQKTRVIEQDKDRQQILTFLLKKLLSMTILCTILLYQFHVSDESLAP